MSHTPASQVKIRTVRYHNGNGAFRIRKEIASSRRPNFGSYSDRGKQCVRWLLIMSTLTDGGGNIMQLARKLRYSSRTIRRDLARLRQMGAPIHASKIENEKYEHVIDVHYSMTFDNFVDWFMSLSAKDIASLENKI